MNMALIFRTKSAISAQHKSTQLVQQPLTLWITGLNGSGKSTLAYALERQLHLAGLKTVVLDGDNLRHGLNQDLDFTDASRSEAVRRVAEVARLFNDAGMIVIVSLISPFANDRAFAAGVVESDRFIEIYMDVAIEVCEARDKKGIYQKARSGEVKNFTGISSLYEEPKNPRFRIDSSCGDPQLHAEEIFNKIKQQFSEGF
jgi:adenylyl-sulfate kinase